jgi:hypothetical protein
MLRGRSGANHNLTASRRLSFVKHTFEWPTHTQETGRSTGRALIHLSQRSDARNVRRGGSGLVLQHLLPLVWLNPRNISLDFSRPTPFNECCTSTRTPIFTDDRAGVPCQRSSGATKLIPMSQTDWGATGRHTVPEFVTVLK